MQEAARVIQEAIDAGEYLSPGEYEAAVKEGFSLCPEESYQLYKEMQNRNQSVSQASDFFILMPGKYLLVIKQSTKATWQLYNC